MILTVIIIISIIAYNRNKIISESITPLEYISNNYKQLSTYILSEKDLKAKYYLYGETHYCKETYLIKASIFSYLIEYGNIRTIIIEKNPFRASFLNYYINTGDTDIFEHLFSEKYSQYYSLSIEESLFWKNICRINLSLPVNRRLSVYGFELTGIDYSIQMFTDYALYVVNKSDCKNKILITVLNKLYDQTSKDSIIERIRSVLDILEKDKKMYLNILADNYTLIYDTLYSFCDLTFDAIKILEKLIVEDSIKMKLMREELIYLNIKYCGSKDNSKILIWYGSDQISSNFGNDIKKFERFSDKLRKSYKSKIISTTLLYHNCLLYYDPIKPQLYSSDFHYLPLLVDVAASNNIVLDLRLPLSPFDISAYRKKPYSYYSDYLILISSRYYKY